MKLAVLLAATLAAACVPEVRPAPSMPVRFPVPTPTAGQAPTALPSSRIVGLAYGGSFCALREDGRVVCWGQNSASSLGDGTNEARSRPALLAGLDGVREIRGLTAYGFCALRGDASLWCWGFGQTGIVAVPTSDVSPRLIARQVTAFGFPEIFPGVCVRHEDGRADCTELRPSEDSGCVVWADEARSSCLFQRRGLKATLKTLSEAGQVIWGGTPHLHGSRSQCVLEGGIVRCTGDNIAGGLGDPSLKRAERPVAVPGMTNIVSLSDSATSTCAVRADGSAWCWGRNAYGEIVVAPDPRPCGDGRAKVTCNRTPTRLPVDDVAQVVLGAQMYVVTRAGALIISRLDGPSPDKATTSLAPLPGLPPVAIVVAGSMTPPTACAVTKAGEVYCFGAGANLGDGTPQVARRPVQIAGIQHAVQVQVDATDACAALEDGTVTCWGDDAAPRGLRDIVAVTPPCALARDGRVWCWGENAQGEMGLGFRGRPGRRNGRDIVHVPLPVPGLRAVRQISSFSGTTCTTDTAGVVRCWGLWGPLSPTEIRGLPPIEQVWSSQHQQCGLARDHQIWCWKTGSAPTPLPAWGRAAGLPSFGPAPESENETCVINTDRTLHCLNTPASLAVLGPVRQLSLAPVRPTRISRGCAVLEDGQLDCWGPAHCNSRAIFCQENHWTRTETPLVGVRQVSVGSFLTCAVRTDGTVWCWGQAGSGGLGEPFPPHDRLVKVDLDHLEPVRAAGDRL